MNKDYKGTIVISVIMSLILLLVAILIWPNNEGKREEKSPQSNEIDSNKTQVKVTVKRINIREDKTVNSKDIGDVFLGEVYTVLEDYEEEDYYWYKIKTNTNITGFIASDKKDEYVEVINGYIDRTPPTINYDKDYFVIVKGEEDYSNITCVDDHSACSLDINRDDLYINITATDSRGNKTNKSIRYYDVYDGGNYFMERNSNLNVNYTRTLNEDGSMYITATYILNQMISSANKSNSYEISVNLYDENFNVIEDYSSKYNMNALDNDCKNDKGMNIKEEFLNENLDVGDKICFNFYTSNHDKVKYLELSISGLDNLDKSDNYLGNYTSRIFVK